MGRRPRERKGKRKPASLNTMPTRAIKFLHQKKISFEVVTYEHGEKGAEFASKATGFPIEKTIKTLVVDFGNKRYAMVLMPGDKQLGLKQLAKACAAKRAAMADTETAERLTGYHVGGISPFGTRQKLPSIMDESLMRFDRVLINGGQRGTMLKMAPGDIVKALGCNVFDVAQK